MAKDHETSDWGVQTLHENNVKPTKLSYEGGDITDDIVGIRQG